MTEFSRSTTQHGVTQQGITQHGRLLARGVARHLLGHGVVTIEEFVPARGLRVDLLGLTTSGEIWVVECKSCRADYMADTKWQGYLDWCDRFFWAVDADFPVELLPDDSGLILSDAYDAEIVRMAPETRLPAARRRKMTQMFGRVAAQRLLSLRDPEARIAF
ncbi:MAG: MmcB family DNA repair protein [Rhodobacterales bacterium]